MLRIALINPNTSQATTAMMTEIARRYAPAHIEIDGVTAQRGVPMIVNEEQLAASADEVIEMGVSAAAKVHGLIISAFGDPGLERLQQVCKIPSVGICEASMLEASAGERRFGIATVTPDLVASFAGKAGKLGLAHLFTGTRLTDGNPVQLASDPEKLKTALERAARQCLEDDGAGAVIIGGGPLGQAAEDLQNRLAAPVIAPIRSAVCLVIRHIDQVNGNVTGEATDARR